MSTSYSRSALAALYVGLVLTVISLLVLYADRAGPNTLAEHVRSGYPDYGPERIDEAVTAYLIVLSLIGACAVVGWLVAIRATWAGKQWARWLVPGLFAVGTSVALFMLLVRDTSGDPGLAPLHGWIGMLPSVAGLAAVILIWRSSRPVDRARR